MISRGIFIVLALAIFAVGCSEDGTSPNSGSAQFELRIENRSSLYEFSAAGVFDTPVGAQGPTPIGPGQAYEFSFSAAPGSRLSFATMFVPSNDFFYAPDEAGIALFDEQGGPIEGEVTDMIHLWDAGTEIDQEPGLGEDQPMRQTGADTGAADPDDSVRQAADSFGNLPAVAAVLKVSISADSETRFTVRIENVSDANTLMTSDGMFQAVPLAPGAFVIHGGEAPLFTAGMADRAEGLEALAEDGNPAGLGAVTAGRTGLTVPLAPGIWVLHSENEPLFTAGEPDRGEGLENLAEDGDPGLLAESLADRMGIEDLGVFNTPDGAGMPGVILPGQAYSFSFRAGEGERLSLATMFVQSNDLFFAPAEAGIALFAAGEAVTGDISDRFMLWDAGTEVNEEPGIGLHQAPRQPGPDSGDAENGVVRLVDDGFGYPALADVIRITLSKN